MRDPRVLFELGVKIHACLHRRDKQEGGKEDAAGGKGKGRKGSPKGPAALKKLMLFLLPLAGKRIVVMLVLAIARTALSNRLARVQVLIFRQKRCCAMLNNLQCSIVQSCQFHLKLSQALKIWYIIAPVMHRRE